MRIALMLLVVMASSLGCSAGDPEDRIQLGDVELVLGMAEEEARARLDASYTLKATSQGGWSVEPLGNPASNLGTVHFTDGRLDYVGKAWRPETQTATALAATFHTAVNEAIRRGDPNCLVSTSESPGAAPNGGTRGFVTLKCGTRTLSLYSPGYDEGIAMVIGDFRRTP